MTERPCCGGGAKTGLRGKLGACKRCIRATIVGLVVCATLLLYAAVAGIAPVVVLLAPVTLAFTALLVAHATAFYLRSTRRWLGAATRRPTFGDRRRFLVGTAITFVAVVVGPGTRRLWGPAVANASGSVDPCGTSCFFAAKVEYTEIAGKD